MSAWRVALGGRGDCGCDISDLFYFLALFLIGCVGVGGEGDGWMDGWWVRLIDNKKKEKNKIGGSGYALRNKHNIS